MTPFTLKLLLSVSLLAVICLAFVFGCGWQAKNDPFYNWDKYDNKMFNVVKTLLLSSLGGSGLLLYLVHTL